MNFWRAILASSQYFDFQDEMRALADRGTLSEAALFRGLERHFPRFPGDHDGMLRGKAFLDYLDGVLRP
jgi:hypothetical protein